MLGKLLEELGEATAIVARCVIQGVGEVEPGTGKPNRVALEDEIADVIAACDIVGRRFRLDMVRMQKRTQAKIAHLEAWHQLLIERGL